METEKDVTTLRATNRINKRRARRGLSPVTISESVQPVQSSSRNERNLLKDIYIGGGVVLASEVILKIAGVNVPPEAGVLAPIAGLAYHALREWRRGARMARITSNNA